MVKNFKNLHQNKQNRVQKKNDFVSTAFTLIELLVVVAIIAMLISILLPAISAARENARSAVCLSGIRQISLAFTQYLDENNGRFMAAVTEREANDSARWGTVPDTLYTRAPFSVRAQLEPFLRNLTVGNTATTNAFKCPSSTVPWPAQAAGKWFTTDYGFNLSEAKYTPTAPGFTANVVSFYQNNPGYGFNEDYTISSIANPSDFLITSDAARADGTPSRGGLYPLQVIDPSNTSQARMLERHRSGANAGFADGHADYTSFQKTWDKHQWQRNP